MDIESKECQEWFLSTARLQSMNKSSKPPGNVEAPVSADSLDLPVEPGFATYPPTVALAQALVLNEQAKAWFPQSMPTPEERLARKVDVEFVL